MLTYLGWLLLALCASAIVLSGVILMRVTSNAVRPVRELARAIENLRETELSNRLGPIGVPVELSPIVEKLNGLLNRLERVFAREKAFTADAAHELRTPLAALMAAQELAVSRQREVPAYVTTINDCRAITERMQSMVENLLLLARADAGQLAVQRQIVNVPALLKESWLMFEHRADGRNLRVQWNVPEQAEADTDADKLRIIFQNLFDNAVCYCNEGGVMRVGCSTRDADLSIEIANSGSTVAAEDVPHLFQRFWRGDQERSETQTHCGLGLSLSQRLATLLGGTITIQTSSGGEFLVRLTIPSAPRGSVNSVQNSAGRLEVQHV